MKFLSPWGPMLTKMKQIVKIGNLKIWKKQNNIVWRYDGEGATHKIWPGSMQRFLRNLCLPTTGACAMTVALLTKSSRAKKSAYKIHTNVQISHK